MNPSDSARAASPGGGFAADLMRSMRCGLITIDRHAKVRFFNDRAAEILEVPAAGAVGRPVQAVLASHPQLARLLAEGLTLSTLPDRAEVEVRTRDRQGRSLGFTLSRILTRRGEVRGAALFFKDLTPIEREEDHRRLQDRLAALGTMAASLAHEIRNPLAALELSATLLARRLSAQGKEAELVATLQEQIRRLSRTVNASLEFVRPLALDRAPTDLVALLEEAMEAAAVPEGAARIEVVRRFPAHTLPVAVDGPRLREAFLNLIRNAIEAMADRGGVLRLAVELPAPGTEKLVGAAATVLVGDSGPGISEGVREKIFNPFFSTKSQGSGLGLAWTRKVVDAHGGTLDVDSQPGQGAQFSIRLPLPADAAQASDLIATGDLLDEAQDSGRRG